jgi:hypothetical protein
MTMMPVCLCMSLAHQALAADASPMTASVDRTQISLQEEAIFTITIDGHSHAQVKLPALPDFNVHERGSSRQMQFINGAMSSQVAYHYALTPTRIGTFVIGAVEAQIGKKVWHSSPFQIVVTQASMAEQDAGDAFLTADVSETNPMVGQQIIYTWRLLRRVHIANGQITLPTFEGFSHQDLGGQKDYKTLINGQQYDVVEMRKALFAEESGQLTIDGSKLSVDVAVSGNGRNSGIAGHPLTNLLGQVRSRNVTLSTPPLTVNVRALPQPTADITHLVGHFTLEAHLGHTSLQVGDSTTLTLTVRGDGYIPSVVEPQMPDLPNVKFYSDKPETQMHVEQDKLVGSRTFRKALVPIAPGTLELPPISLPYFDPSTQSYQTASTPIYVIHVAPNPKAPLAPAAPTAPAQAPVQKLDIKVLHDDILPLFRNHDALLPRFSMAQRLALGLLFGLPPALFFGLWLYHRQKQAAKDVVAQRRRNAYKRSLQAIEQMAQALTALEPTKAAALGSRALREFLGDRLGLEGLALTPNEARRLLQAQGVPASLCVTVEGLLQRLEAAQYGAALMGTSGTDEAQQMRDVLLDLHKQLPS